jgi:hypothetical protein
LLQLKAVRFPSESHGFFVLAQRGERPNFPPPIVIALSHRMLTHHTSPGGAALPHAGAERPRGVKGEKTPSSP